MLFYKFQSLIIPKTKSSDYMLFEKNTESPFVGQERDFTVHIEDKVVTLEIG